MTLDELIQQGWADHDPKSEEVADRLEAHVELVADAPGAAGFMNLASHTIGDHLGDRARALRVCEAAVRRLGEDPGDGPRLYLTVARELAGDDAGAADLRRALSVDPANAVRIDMLVAQGLMHGGDWRAATERYEAALAAGDALAEGHAAERAIAITSNNIASELLGLSTRSDTQDALMETAAKAARTYWTRIGTWVNDERADYLLASVHTALGRPAEARMYAERGLQTIVDGDGEEKVDEAFLHLARAAACRDLGALDDQAASLAHAEVLAREFEGAWLTEWFEAERAKAQ